jgi:hypothetical protein
VWDTADEHQLGKWAPLPDLFPSVSRVIFLRLCCDTTNDERLSRFWLYSFGGQLREHRVSWVGRVGGHGQGNGPKSFGVRQLEVDWAPWGQRQWWQQSGRLPRNRRWWQLRLIGVNDDDDHFEHDNDHHVEHDDDHHFEHDDNHRDHRSNRSRVGDWGREVALPRLGCI